MRRRDGAAARSLSFVKENARGGIDVPPRKGGSKVGAVAARFGAIGCYPRWNVFRPGRSGFLATAQWGRLPRHCSLRGRRRRSTRWGAFLRSRARSFGVQVAPLSARRPGSKRPHAPACYNRAQDKQMESSLLRRLWNALKPPPAVRLALALHSAAETHPDRHFFGAGGRWPRSRGVGLHGRGPGSRAGAAGRGHARRWRAQPIGRP